MSDTDGNLFVLFVLYVVEWYCEIECESGGGLISFSAAAVIIFLSGQDALPPSCAYGRVEQWQLVSLIS